MFRIRPLGFLLVVSLAACTPVSTGPRWTCPPEGAGPTTQPVAVGSTVSFGQTLLRLVPLPPDVAADADPGADNKQELTP